MIPVESNQYLDGAHSVPKCMYLMIAGLPKDYSTIYTVVKTAQGMSKHLQQSTAVITFDLAANLFQGRRNPMALSRRVPKPGDLLRGVSHSTQLIGLNWKDVSGELLRGCVYRVWPLQIKLYYGTIAGKILQQGNDYGEATAFEMGCT